MEIGSGCPGRAGLADGFYRREFKDIKLVAHRVFFFIASPMDVEMARTIKAVSPELKLLVDLLSWWKIEEIPTFVIKALDADAVFASEWFFPKNGFSEAKAAGAQVQVFLWDGENLSQRMRRAARLGAQVVSCDRSDLLLPVIQPAKSKRE